MNARTSFTLPVLGIGALALVAAGCGSDEPGASAAVPGTSPASSEVVGSGPDSTMEETFEVALAEGTPLGTILVDPDGMTLYSTEREAAGEIECVDDCAEDWLPVPVSEEPVVPAELVDRVGTIERPDGTLQATFDDMPLYRFVFDEQPGDTFGDNLEDVFGGTGFLWHAAVLTDAAPTSTDASPSSTDASPSSTDASPSSTDTTGGGAASEESTTTPYDDPYNY